MTSKSTRRGEKRLRLKKEVDSKPHQLVLGSLGMIASIISLVWALSVAESSGGILHGLGLTTIIITLFAILSISLAAFITYFEGRRVYCVEVDEEYEEEDEDEDDGGRRR